MKPMTYQLKVTLKNTNPPIWRRFEVKGGITLEQFHWILQYVMGWTNSHLHHFVVGEKYYGKPDPEFAFDVVNEKEVHLNQVLRKPKDRMLYEYDFGDSWLHDLLLEEAKPASAAKDGPPVVIAGEGSCPPEDCGGITGFYHLLRVIKNPNHPEYEEMMEWSFGAFDPDGFDPDGFDIDELNMFFEDWQESAGQ